MSIVQYLPFEDGHDSLIITLLWYINWINLQSGKTHVNYEMKWKEKGTGTSLGDWNVSRISRWEWDRMDVVFFIYYLLFISWLIGINFFVANK